MTRKGAALVLACWLNLLLLPCAMALEAPDEAHDCCPPEIEWQQIECCEIVGIAVEKRDDRPVYDDDPEFDSVVEIKFESRPPPDPPPQSLPPPPRASTALHKLFCVYLD